MATRKGSKFARGGDHALALVRAFDTYTREEQTRDYIGASVIANPCDRFLFYVKEQVAGTPPDAKGLRIFEFGDAIERLVVDRWLPAVGYEVRWTVGKAGEQLRVAVGNGVLQGHTDGVILRVSETDRVRTARDPHLLEVKSAKNERFQDLVDLGVKEAKFEHYAQMQVYLHAEDQLRFGFNVKAQINAALYVCVNKDTCDIYVEQVPYDQETADLLVARASRIHSAKRPPDRISPDANKWPCSRCNYQVHCFQDTRGEEASARGASRPIHKRK